MNRYAVLISFIVVLSSLTVIAQNHPDGDEPTLVYAQYINPGESDIISQVIGQSTTDIIYTLTYPGELDGLIVSPLNGIYYLFDNEAHIFNGDMFETAWSLPDIPSVEDIRARAVAPEEFEPLSGDILLKDIVLAPDEISMVFDLLTVDDMGRITNEFLVLYNQDSDLFRLIEIEDRDLNAPANIGNIRWSPDGSTLAYAYPTSGQIDTEHITLATRCTVDITTSCEVTRLDLPDERPYLRTFDWSPDGERIAYSCSDNHLASHEICITDLDGNLLDEFITIESFKFDLHWSPDGSMIAYAGHPPNNQEQDIYVLNLDTGEETNLSNSEGILESTPFWWTVDG